MLINKSGNNKKVCHVTSAHSRYDVRIFHKECKTLAENGYKVFLLVNDDRNDELIDGINIISTYFSPKSRYERMLISQKRIRDKAIEIDADIYHFHDPELLPLASYMKYKGKKAIFDSHEDYFLTISDKSWIPSLLRSTMKYLYRIYEESVLKKLDGAVVCYHWTEVRFKQHCKNVKTILNFPDIRNEIHKPEIDYSRRAISFAGGISPQWCHREIIQALSRLDNVNYELAGRIKGQYGNELQQLDGWQYVNYHGVISQKDVFKKVYASSSIGMALLDYIPQCKGTIGNLSNTKFFEYMYMGLPLICTDFVLWKEVINEEKCGICVNPHNIDEVTNAIDYLLNNIETAKQMGLNGRKAVLEKYNWQAEEIKLLELYSLIQ